MGWGGVLIFLILLLRSTYSPDVKLWAVVVHLSPTLLRPQNREDINGIMERTLV